jgi:hypothetical protein
MEANLCRFILYRFVYKCIFERYPIIKRGGEGREMGSHSSIKHCHSMDTTWTQHGHSMDTTWTQHGHIMDRTWTENGHNINMDTAWTEHGQNMDTT